MESKWETITYEKIDAVARIMMNRPEVRNAQNQKMTFELDDAFREAVADDEVKVIIFGGTGPHFSSGHDLNLAMRKAEEEKRPTKPGVRGRMERELEIYMDMCFRWRELPKPTIAQVQGVCIAGGWMLAAVCDLIVASEDARFAQPSLRMGGSGVEYFSQPWDLGTRKAKEILFTGEFLDAQDAWRLGFVNRVVPRDKLEEETLKLAQKIALMPAFALQMTKISVNDVQDIMGFRNSMLSTFKAHLIANAHTAELQGGAHLLNRQAEGQSVKDFVNQRDNPFHGKQGEEAPRR